MNRALRILATAGVVATMAAAAQPALADHHVATGHAAHTSSATAPAKTGHGAMSHGNMGHGEMVHGDVIGLDGKSLGMVMVQQTPAGVLVTTDLAGLPQGDHGFHFHEKGLCSAADKFTTAGGHFATGHQHGLLTEGGPHGGDMPNQYVGADGFLKVQVLNTGVTLTPGETSIFDADGTALVIHAKADDYTSQPSGNAGDRIACAVLAKPK